MNTVTKKGETEVQNSFKKNEHVRPHGLPRAHMHVCIFIYLYAILNAMEKLDGYLLVCT